MKINLTQISVNDLVSEYSNHLEDGVFGYRGRLSIRPPYQREFVYNQKQQEAVVNSVLNDFPLNTMYWVLNPDGTYELLDGQQRTLSLCSYINGDFSVNHQYFHNLTKDEQNTILDYKLLIYVCEGTAAEKLEWFQTINIAGEALTRQEVRNAIYSGAWVTNAKAHFSKIGCPASNLYSDYLKGKAIRQEYFETVLKWISDDNIEEYMAEHQYDENASELWSYFHRVMNWVQATFKEYRKEMKGVNFGYLYGEFGTTHFDPDDLEEEIEELMRDEDVTKKAGIYSYVLTREPSYLNIRSFSQKQKREMYENQDGICLDCGDRKELNQMHADHIIPWSKGGQTKIENGQMLCKKCNKAKSNK